MVSRQIYEIVGFLCGFVLIDYGYNLLAVGLPGTRQVASQFLGINLVLTGSGVAFTSLYYWLKPVAKATPSVPQPSAEGAIIEKGPELVGFYKNVGYLGYFITALGLFAAADVALQAIIPQSYSATRWSIEVILVMFGVLSYALFGSIRRIGGREEKQYVSSAQPAIAGGVASEPSSFTDVLQVRLSEFSKSSSGEYERQLSPAVYDMFRIEREVVTIWREDRRPMRSVYLAGPYELTRKLMEDYVNRGEELKIGHLSLPAGTIRKLLNLQQSAEIEVPAEVAELEPGENYYR